MAHNTWQGDRLYLRSIDYGVGALLRRSPYKGITYCQLQKGVSVKTYLEVPFGEHYRAKALGARFDLSAKKWFCPDGVDLMLFVDWLPRSMAKWANLPGDNARKKRARRDAFRTRT